MQCSDPRSTAPVAVMIIIWKDLPGDRELFEPVAVPEAQRKSRIKLKNRTLFQSSKLDE